MPASAPAVSAALVPTDGEETAGGSALSAATELSMLTRSAADLHGSQRHRVSRRALHSGHHGHDICTAHSQTAHKYNLAYQEV